MSAEFLQSEVSKTLMPIEEARWLPQRAYIDDGVYQAEIREIFSKEWIPVLHHSSLPNTGDFRTIEIIGKPLLFVRDDDGAVRCFINICRHRGMAVASGHGNCKAFVCPYHRWSYNLDGKIKSTPMIKGDWAKGTEGLTEVRTEIFLGLVCINFSGDKAPPASEGLQELADAFAPWNPDKMQVSYELTYNCPWNWKLMLENGIEGYHIIGTHRESVQDFSPGELCYVSTPDGATRYDILHTPLRERAPAPEDDGTGPVYPAAYPEWAEREARFYNLRPSLVLWNSGPNMIISLVLPQSKSETLVTHTEIVAPETKRRPDFEVWKEQNAALMDVIQQEDDTPCRRIQKSYEGSNEWIPGPYQTDAERADWNFHQWYLEKMGVAAG